LNRRNSGSTVALLDIACRHPASGSREIEADNDANLGYELNRQEDLSVS
jgi:hypothetical protein